MSDSTNKSKIFYDGNCVVCDMEISHYKRIAPDLFELVDISAPEFKAEAFGFNAKDVDRDLHVLTPDQKLVVGVEAFAHIWSRIPKYRRLEKLIHLPVISPAARAGYKVFTVIRPWLPKKQR